jgi:phosphoribosylformimino-5-aminoimidazole carboxamide ribotide isomerase
MEVIPSIDLLAGRVVRLLRGSYDAVTVYAEDAAALAAGWRGQAQRLHVVDLEGARAGRAVQTDFVKQIVAAFGPGLQVGGGVRSLEAVDSYLELGAERVVLGTAAVRSPAIVQQTALAHPGRIVVAVDAKNGNVATDGWETETSVRAVDLVRELEGLPLAGVLYTDIERDGTETGPNIDATAELARSTALPVIASGGVGTLEHLARLAERGIAAAIVGRALHEGRFTLAEARARLG